MTSTPTSLGKSYAMNHPIQQITGAASGFQVNLLKTVEAVRITSAIKAHSTAYLQQQLQAATWFAQEIEQELDRRNEKLSDEIEMDNLLKEIHHERIGFMRELHAERKTNTRNEQRQKRREEWAHEKQEKQERKFRDNSFRSLARRQQRSIRAEARFFKQLQKRIQAEEEARRLKEEDEGWQVVTYKRHSSK